MGKAFGNLYYIRNVIYYKVSSYEQKALPDFLWASFKNLTSETMKYAPLIVPPMTIGYLTIQYCLDERMRMIRKDPKIDLIEVD